MGLGKANKPSLTAGSADLAKNGTVSPLSVSIKSNDAGTSPTIINLAEDLISILALTENVWLRCAPLCRCQLVGLSENNSLLVPVVSSMKKGTQLCAAKPTNRQPEHGAGEGSRVSRWSRLLAIRMGW